MASEDGASAQYRRGMEHLLAGDVDEAIATLEQAAKVPVMRFPAAAVNGERRLPHGATDPQPVERGENRANPEPDGDTPGSG